MAIDIGMSKSVFDAFEQSAELHSTRPFLRAPKTSTQAYADAAIEYSYTQARERVRGALAELPDPLVGKDGRVLHRSIHASQIEGELKKRLR